MVLTFCSRVFIPVVCPVADTWPWSGSLSTTCVKTGDRHLALTRNLFNTIYQCFDRWQPLGHDQELCQLPVFRLMAATQPWQGPLSTTCVLPGGSRLALTRTLLISSLGEGSAPANIKSQKTCKCEPGCRCDRQKRNLDMKEGRKWWRAEIGVRDFEMLKLLTMTAAKIVMNDAMEWFL